MFFKKKKLNILVIGSNGMLGHDVLTSLVKRSSTSNSNIGIVNGIDKEDNVDISNLLDVTSFLYNKIHYDYIINCAAYTDTQKIESTAEGLQTSYKLNVLVPRVLALACKNSKSKLIHISTDYVFSQYSRRLCNRTCDPNHHIPYFSSFSDYGLYEYPINIYGTHKLMGENNIMQVFNSDTSKFCILRTSWLYGQHNQKSFIHKFINNIVNNTKANDTPTVECVSNEVSVPTSTEFVSNFIYGGIYHNIGGIHNAVPDVETKLSDKKQPLYYNKGVSRYEWCSEIIKNLSYMFKEKFKYKDIKLIPIQSDNNFRPTYSVLVSDEFLVGTNITWKQDLALFLHDNKDYFEDLVCE